MNTLKSGKITLFLITACMALPASSEPNTDTNKQELFERMQQLESESHKKRISILEEAEACIRQARDFREYRECEQQEKQARHAFKQEHKPQKQALREEMRAFRQQRMSQR